MSSITDILSATSHRPFQIPQGQWRYYQEWNDALMFHWKVPFDLLRKIVPSKLIIDSFEGDYYISIVAFTMQRIRPKNLPAVKFFSDFHEINVRTYIDNGNKKGVYFINIEAQKHLSAFMARNLSGLPYEKANIKRTAKEYHSTNAVKSFYIDTEFEVKELMLHKTAIDKWLTERYCLYLDHGENIFRYDIHHKEWQLKQLEVKRLHIKYKVGDIIVGDRNPDIMHYSDGVQVVAWKKQKI